MKAKNKDRNFICGCISTALVAAAGIYCMLALKDYLGHFIASWTNDTYQVFTQLAVTLAVAAVLLLAITISCHSRARQMKAAIALMEENLKNKNIVIEKLNNERTFRKLVDDGIALPADNVREYQIKLYLNMWHFVTRDGVEGQRHHHTWEFTLSLQAPRSMNYRFDDLKKPFECFLDIYEDKVLNELNPFDHVMPTLENVTDYFATNMAALASKMDCRLTRVSASESPVKTYIVSLDNSRSDNPVCLKTTVSDAYKE